jgi:hypothetical protein
VAVDVAVGAGVEVGGSVGSGAGVDLEGQAAAVKSSSTAAPNRLSACRGWRWVALGFMSFFLGGRRCLTNKKKGYPSSIISILPVQPNCCYARDRA